jgi:hypothetical protein
MTVFELLAMAWRTCTVVLLFWLMLAGRRGLEDVRRELDDRRH